MFHCLVSLFWWTFVLWKCFHLLCCRWQPVMFNQKKSKSFIWQCNKGWVCSRNRSKRSPIVLALPLIRTSDITIIMYQLIKYSFLSDNGLPSKTFMYAWLSSLFIVVRIISVFEIQYSTRTILPLAMTCHLGTMWQEHHSSWTCLCSCCKVAIIWLIIYASMDASKGRHGRKIFLQQDIWILLLQ